MPVERKWTRPVRVRDVAIGGKAAISIQSMTKTPLTNVKDTVDQILKLREKGAAIVRLAVPDLEALEAFRAVRRQVDVPLVADIHFDYRLALGSIEAGADKLRINPGNLGATDRLRQVARAARERSVPIRVGVNGGSLERDLLEKYGGPTAEAIAESALRNAGMLSEMGFEDIVISAKSSNVMETIRAYRIISSRCDYPLHIGITETGPGVMGVIKSAVGIGALLSEGIGDTIRVSLTAPPEEEVEAGRMILASLGLAGPTVNIISCPTCGRTRGPLIELAQAVKAALEGIGSNITVAVMGCEVNGPGEAREADLGLALTRSGAVLFESGKVVASGPAHKLLDALVEKVRRGLTPQGHTGKIPSESQRPGS